VRESLRWGGRVLDWHRRAYQSDQPYAVRFILCECVCLCSCVCVCVCVRACLRVSSQATSILSYRYFTHGACDSIAAAHSRPRHTHRAVLSSSRALLSTL